MIGVIRDNSTVSDTAQHLLLGLIELLGLLGLLGILGLLRLLVGLLLLGVLLW